MNKNISKTKLFLAFISLIITFFVWQQGLRDSLSRPSVGFDISQKEKEIAELALPAIPVRFKTLLLIIQLKKLKLRFLRFLLMN